jgi:biofilm PGA synthesis N-glycosyltransferase PgaC
VIATVGFCCAAVFLFYVLLGYPWLLRKLALRKAHPVRRAPVEPTVSILICVYNGAAYLDKKLHSILALEYPREKMEILVISDGSTDSTNAIAERFACEGVRLIRIPRSGKPSAINAGIVEARGEILVLTDVRQVLASDSLRLLMENFNDATVGACSAELVIGKGSTQDEANVGLYWRYEFAIRMCLSEIDSIFGATGAYYALRRELAVPLPATTLLDDMYLPLAAFFRGYRLVVDPRARMFDYPTGTSSEFWRKVRTLAGNYQILLAYPQLLGPGNRLWFHFISYKLARLLLPFALLAMAWFGGQLPTLWARAAVMVQISFYAAALGDLWVPESFHLIKRLTSPIRIFVVFMVAALCAISVLFLPSSAFWRSASLRTECRT